MSQEEEVEALTLLYQPDQFHASRDPNTSLLTGWYRAHPKLPRDSTALRVRIHVSSQTKKLVTYEQPQFLRLDNSFCKVFFIQHLPPITVHFTLPQDYPADAIPQLSLESSWILSDRLRSIVDQLNTFVCTRESGEPCMWECFDFLECNLFSSLLGLTKDESGDYLYDIEAAIPSRRMREYALEVLVNYDNSARRRKFNEEKMECLVCMDDGKLGRECTRLNACGHVTCHECLRSALYAHIAEGVMAGVFRCLHCKTVADLNEVKEFATPSQLEAYDSLLLQRSLALMNDVVKCPRPGCSATCWQDDDFRARCPLCQHAFCPRCLRIYHPGLPCEPPSVPLEIVADHQKRQKKVGEGEEEEKEDGKEGEEENFIRYEDEMVSIHEEDTSNLLWHIAHESDVTKRRRIIDEVIGLRKSTRAEILVSRSFKGMKFNRCPTCGMFVDKFTGCNYVFCPICQKTFQFGS